MNGTLVTLFTDASVLPGGSAGWGYWAKRDNASSINGGGRFRDLITNVQEAESAAIANAVHRLLKLEYIKRGDHVLIQTDALTVVQYWESGRKILPARVRIAFDTLRARASTHALTYQFRHVKGHVDAGGRHYCNNTADKWAKRYARGI